MAMTPAEINALTSELESLARNSKSLRDLREMLKNLNNQDLSQITSQVQEVKEAVVAQTASNNASVLSLNARVTALQAEAAAYANTTREAEKIIKTKEAELELERAMLATGQTTIEMVKQKEEELVDAFKSWSATSKRSSVRCTLLKTRSFASLTTGKKLISPIGPELALAQTPVTFRAWERSQPTLKSKNVSTLFISC